MFVLPGKVLALRVLLRVPLVLRVLRRLDELRVLLRELRDELALVLDALRVLGARELERVLLRFARRPLLLLAGDIELERLLLRVTDELLGRYVERVVRELLLEGARLEERLLRELLLELLRELLLGLLRELLRELLLELLRELRPNELLREELGVLRLADDDLERLLERDGARLLDRLLERLERDGARLLDRPEDRAEPLERETPPERPPPRN
ncbi:MAG: hypothetical protein L3J82_00675 [Planctomycetes bacterium]|nr:hypothetical protein [Planctomycetota bacterium]